MKTWLIEEESGQGMVEYGLIIALVSIVAIVALKSVGPELTTLFTNINTPLEGK